MGIICSTYKLALEPVSTSVLPNTTPSTPNFAPHAPIHAKTATLTLLTRPISSVPPVFPTLRFTTTRTNAYYPVHAPTSLTPSLILQLKKGDVPIVSTTVGVAKMMGRRVLIARWGFICWKKGVVWRGKVVRMALWEWFTQKVGRETVKTVHPRVKHVPLSQPPAHPAWLRSTSTNKQVSV